MTTVLIVDDHDGFRSLARRLLEAAGHEVVGEARDGRTALAAARDLAPDVVLLDVQLPDMDGFEVAERLRAEGTRPEVVLISTRARHDYPGRLRGCAAPGFISKSELTAPRLRALLAEP